MKNGEWSVLGTCFIRHSSLDIRHSVGRYMQRVILTCLVLLWAGTADELAAHDPGLSAVEVRFQEEHLDLALTLARPDLEALVPLDGDRNGKISAEELARGRPELDALARRAFEVRTDRSRP